MKVILISICVSLGLLIVLVQSQARADEARAPFSTETALRRHIIQQDAVIAAAQQEQTRLSRIIAKFEARMVRFGELCKDQPLPPTFSVAHTNICWAVLGK